MKKYLLLIISVFVVCNVFAQYEIPGMPLAFQLEKQSLRRSAFDFFIDINADTTKISSEKVQSERREFITGVTCPVDINIANAQYFVENDVKVYRVGLRSNEAKGISLYFDRF